MTHKRFFSVLLACLMLFSLVPLRANAEESDELKVGINVANKIDVALALGVTEVNYARFEEDLLEALSKLEPAVDPADINIMASSSVDASSSTEFSWWTYDHSTTATINKESNIYIENLNDEKTQATNAYNTKPRHIQPNESGSNMEFFGYGTTGYKDFLYMPNDQRTKKTFTFDIEEKSAYDALDGPGFFFNTQITGEYRNGQTMSGYLLHLNYNGSGVGNEMRLYQFSNVDTKAFHHTPGSYVNMIIEDNPSFILLATAAYSNAHKFRTFKIVAEPDSVTMWYKGSSSEKNLTLDDETDLVEWTYAAGSEKDGKTTVPEFTMASSYGFGPMISYRDHGCSKLTNVLLENLSMTYGRVRSLIEVVREPAWNDNTKKFLVNLNEDPIADFADVKITAELLNRLNDDDIYYIGWCGENNVDASEEFLDKHGLKGGIVNVNAAATDTYEEQIAAIAGQIHSRYWTVIDQETVLITDNVVLDVSNADISDTIELPDYPDGKWKIVHDPSTVDNDMGLHPRSGLTVSDLVADFTYPGDYTIYYKDEPVTVIHAHRAPVAKIEVEDGVISSGSYDPDDDEAQLEESWSYLDLDGADPSLIVEGKPAALQENHTYLLMLTVTDAKGATSATSRQIGTHTESGANLPPFASFTLSKSVIAIGVDSPYITITDNSYDPQGDPLTLHTFTVKRNGSEVQDVAMQVGVNDLTNAPAGQYSVSLVVTSKNGTSVAYTRSFEITKDEIAPTAASTPAAGHFRDPTSVQVRFTDEGGSGLKERRVAVTDSADTPAADSTAWAQKTPGAVYYFAVTTAGPYYLHYEAWDNAGNKGTGKLGPYSYEKKDVSLSLAANPADGSEYPAPITLTATLTGDDLPAGNVSFYVGDTLIGTLAHDEGVAQIVYTPAAKGDVTFKAVFQETALHKAAQDTLAHSIAPNSNVAVTVGGQDDLVYGNTPYIPGDIAVTPGIDYEIIYTGRDGTTYGPSAIAPTEAGDYTVTVTTTSPNYAETTDSADFSILERPLTLTVLPESSEDSGDVGLSCEIAGLAPGQEPKGSVTFYVDGQPVAQDVPITLVDGKYVASTDAWTGAAGDGNYTVSAQYNPAPGESYSAPDQAKIEDYSPAKSNQTGFGFPGASIGKTYGDDAFFVAAAGGNGAGGITYSVQSGADVVSADAASGKITILAAGKATVLATKAGDGTYLPATALIDIDVSKAQAAVRIAGESVVHGNAFTYTVTAQTGDGLLGAIFTGRDGTTYGPTAEYPQDLGKYTLTVAAAESRNYHAASAALNFSILPCACEIKTITFPGKTLEIDYYATGLDHPLSALSSIHTCCPEHGTNASYAYSAEGNLPAGVTLDGDVLRVTDAAAGKTAQINVRVTHLATGNSELQTATFTIKKGVCDAIEITDEQPSYNKNTSQGGLVIPLNPNRNTLQEVTFKGETLKPGVDYVFQNNQVVFSPAFEDRLRAGDNAIEFVFSNGESKTVTVSLDEGVVIPKVDVHKDAMQVSTTADLKKLATSPADLEHIARGLNIEINLIVTPVTDQTIHEDLKKKLAEQQLLASVVDVCIIKRVEKQDPEYIKELSEAIPLTFEIPYDLRGHEEYWLMRVHDYEDARGVIYDMLPDLDDNPNTFSTQSDKFSLYLLIYKEKAIKTDDSIVPKTGDTNNMMPFLWLGCATLAATAACVVILRKRRRAQA